MYCKHCVKTSGAPLYVRMTPPPPNEHHLIVAYDHKHGAQSLFRQGQPSHPGGKGLQAVIGYRESAAPAQLGRGQPSRCLQSSHGPPILRGPSICLGSNDSNSYKYAGPVLADIQLWPKPSVRLFLQGGKPMNGECFSWNANLFFFCFFFFGKNMFWWVVSDVGWLIVMVRNKTRCMSAWTWTGESTRAWSEVSESLLITPLSLPSVQRDARKQQPLVEAAVGFACAFCSGQWLGYLHWLACQSSCQFNLSYFIVLGARPKCFVC